MHGSSFSKYGIISRLCNFRLICTLPTSSTPCSWKTDFAVSKPILVILMVGGSFSTGSSDPYYGTLMPRGAVHPICGGRRDRALLLLAVQTGLRASELLSLRCQDIVLGPGAHVRCHGKGRKVRNTPLRKETITVLRGWLQELHCQPSDPAFSTTSGTALSHDGLQYFL